MEGIELEFYLCDMPLNEETLVRLYRDKAYIQSCLDMWSLLGYHGNTSFAEKNIQKLSRDIITVEVALGLVEEDEEDMGA